MTMLSNPSAISSSSSVSMEQGSQDVTSLDAISSPAVISQVRVHANERDLCNHTALILAVTNDDESCCLALLGNRADPNTRDAYRYTALEVAARAGYFNIVQLLITFDTCVNPNMGCCSSSPLQAAVQSDNFNLELIQLLRNHGARLDIRRYDNKNAIDLANERGLHELAQTMQQSTADRDQSQYPFAIGDQIPGPSHS